MEVTTERAAERAHAERRLDEPKATARSLVKNAAEYSWVVRECLSARDQIRKAEAVLS